MKAYNAHEEGCHCDACEQARAADPDTYDLGKQHFNNPNLPNGVYLDMGPGGLNYGRYDGGPAAHLPAGAAERKAIPAASGFIDYFPDAMIAVAALSKIGNDQHNPGRPLFWDRTKSTDEADCLIRHFIDRGTLDTDGVRHSAKLAWRAMALLQKEIEAERATPSASGAAGERLAPASERALAFRRGLIRHEDDPL